MIIGLGLQIFTKYWTLVGLGLKFKNSGLDLDCKILQSGHLWLEGHGSNLININFRQAGSLHNGAAQWAAEKGGPTLMCSLSALMGGPPVHPVVKTAGPPICTASRGSRPAQNSCFFNWKHGPPTRPARRPSV